MVNQRDPRTPYVMDRKRLELARALGTSPKLLMLRRVYGGADSGGDRRGDAAHPRAAKSGLTLILVEHIVWALLDLSQRIIAQRRGEDCRGSPASIAKDPQVIEVYLGESARFKEFQRFQRFQPFKSFDPVEMLESNVA
jgi:branched-chain amino acid transport system ATP-binding protein